MFLNAKNGTLTIDNTTMDYICFGTGTRTLIMLPGLGDSLRSVKGTALPVAIIYRLFAGDFTVYMFSRKASLPEGCTTADMAEDLKKAMDLLDIEKADLFGVSMGGMIAQQFAIRYPHRLNKLVLAVTSPQPNPMLEESIQEWLACVNANNHTALMESNLRRIYSDSYYRKNKWMVPFLGMLTKPRSYDRFLVQANACLTHDVFSQLRCISAETLVIGGQQDIALGAEPSHRIAAQIPHASLKMYDRWGHGVYEEAPDFNKTILDFLLA